jgi:chitinase
MQGHKHLFCLAGAFIASGQALLSTGVQVPSGLFQGTRTAGCPLSCSDVGDNPSNWTQLRGAQDLARCNGTFLLDMNVQTPAYTVSCLRVCDAGGNGTLASPSHPANATLQSRSSLEVSTNCGAKAVTNTTTITTTYSNGDTQMETADISLAAQLLASYLEDSASCGRTIVGC